MRPTEIMPELHALGLALFVFRLGLSTLDLIEKLLNCPKRSVYLPIYLSCTTKFWQAVTTLIQTLSSYGYTQILDFTFLS